MKRYIRSAEVSGAQYVVALTDQSGQVLGYLGKLVMDRNGLDPFFTDGEVLESPNYFGSNMKAKIYNKQSSAKQVRTKILRQSDGRIAGIAVGPSWLGWVRDIKGDAILVGDELKPYYLEVLELESIS